MKGSKAFYLLAVISAVLIIGVAYAAVTAINFDVTGTATAAPAEDASNYDVKITSATHTTSNEGITVTEDYSKGNIATYTVSGMKEVGDEAQVVFTITNASRDLKAVLSSLNTVVSGDTDYFTVTDGKLSDLEVAADGGTVTLTVNVKLARASVASKTVTIKTTFVATPQDK